MKDFDYLLSRYGSFRPGYDSGNVVWSHWDLLFIHSGSLSVLASGKEMRLDRGEAVLIPPGQTFRIRNGSGNTTASVQYFIPAAGGSISKYLVAQKKPVLFSGVKELHIESHIRELLDIFESPETVSRRQELLLALILEKIRLRGEEKKPSKSLWDDLIRHYADHMSERPSVEDLARLAGYSPGRFRVLFRNRTGLPPAVYFLDMRMEKGAALLKETIMPVKRIAFECGYGEASHFHRAFLARYGQTPGNYRKRNRFIG